MTNSYARSELSASLNTKGGFRSNLPFKAPSLSGDYWSAAEGIHRAGGRDNCQVHEAGPKAGRQHVLRIFGQTKQPDRSRDGS